MSVKLNRHQQRRRRHLRVRSKIQGTAQRPRLCVTKTLRHLYAQVIDDDTGRTLAAASTRDPAIATGLSGTSNIEAARAVGKAVAERATAAGIHAVVFDRSGWPYWGRVRALADAAREGGLKF